MKNYTSFKEIDRDLKQLALERDIALEELKGVKNDFEQSLKPLNILSSSLKFLSKYSALVFIKKIFK
ncbi:hypothetical protein BXQ17_13450 [Polaribacter sp. BM10]|uniref:DUF6327 family protein n=1 Tax=Polaribacter sp. BM10 TaxID=1529069 RepID=UPI00098A444D|nr:DUF6327 family protein [Polaribacter sp. BM10]AQS95021.1 hypothetical protein BXQ17_13450 [Polaribacter sp. BM10]